MMLVSNVAVKHAAVSDTTQTTQSKFAKKQFLFLASGRLQQVKSIGVSLANSCRREQSSKFSKALERRRTADADRQYTHQHGHTHTHSSSSPEF